MKKQDEYLTAKHFLLPFAMLILAAATACFGPAVLSVAENGYQSLRATVASYFELAAAPRTPHPALRRAGYIVTGMPDKAPWKIFLMSNDEPIATVYEAMEWVHNAGGGKVQIEQASLRRGKKIDYFGCDPSRGGKCFPDVYVITQRY